MPKTRSRRSSGGSSPRSSRSASKARGRKPAGKKANEDPWSLFGPLSRWWMRHPRLQLLLAIAGFTSGVLLVALFGIFLHYDRQAAKFDLRQVARMPKESKIYDTQGATIGYVHGDGRTIVPLDQVSDHFENALIAREDSRFFTHGGFDFWALFRAGLRNAHDRNVVQGASTLTMQLARNTFGMLEKTFNRKLVELALARRIEGAYSKQEILELYVNRIFFGTGMNGIEQAARGYFGKSAVDLDLVESAMIAGIIRAPNRFSPYRHYEAALREMQDTLDRMVAEGMISPEEAEIAKRRRPPVLPQEQGMRLSGKPGRISEETYLTGAIRQELDRLLSEKQLDRGGFEIFTTFDLGLQAAVESAVEARLGAIELQPGYPHPTYAAFDSRFSADPSLEPGYLQAAVSVIDNHSGAIRAMVGGRDFSHSRFNRATQAQRQAGSVFKPLVYATAFETGLFPGTYISDDPIKSGEIRWDRGNWSPHNSDGQHLGLEPAEQGLIRSRNTMSVRVGERAGIDSVMTMIDHAGLRDGSENAARSPQIYIGNLGATLTSLVSAYSAFPNAGERGEPFMIERIEARDGEILFERPQTTERVFSPGASWLVTRLMEETLEPGGTGASVRRLGLDAPAGGKTGTTKNFRDAWFIGFTNRLSAGVWVGLDQPEKIVDAGYGSRLALPIWTDLMLAAEELGYEFGELPEPDDIMDIELCRFSGHLAGDGCRKMGCAYKEEVPEPMIPRSICATHSGKLKNLTREEATSVGGKRGFFNRLRGVLGIE